MKDAEKRSVRYGGWICGIIGLTLVTVTVHAATTKVTTALTQGLPIASTICDEMSETPLGPGTLSFEECFQGGSTGSGPGIGDFDGEGRTITAYDFFNPQQGLELSLFADSSATVTDDFVGLYEYATVATNTFLDQITITGGTPGVQGIVQVTLDIEGEIMTTGNAAPGSAFLEITVSSPFGADSLKFLTTPAPGPRVFEVPYFFGDDPMDLEIFVEAFAGQVVDPGLGAFAATQKVDFADTIKLLSVEVKGVANGQVISATGFPYPAAPFEARVGQTGQTTVYSPGDDGDYQAGIPWPSPRFTDNDDGTVLDNLTGLTWLQEFKCPIGMGSVPWQGALDYIDELNTTGRMNGVDCMDTSNGGSFQTDWRLPNVKEFLSLVDWGAANPPLPPNPFLNVVPQNYWTSTTDNSDAGRAWAIKLTTGEPRSYNKVAVPARIAAVRGGMLE